MGEGMADAEAEQAKAVQQIHETLGVRLFTHPPEGFDPVMASDRELLVHGFPARPDAHINPEVYEYWQQLMSRPMTIIQPQFGIKRDWENGLRPAVAPAGGDGWSGSAVQLHTDDEDAFTFVAGQWTVPDIVDPSPGQNAVCGCAVWVGIDGYNDLSHAILQAGTTQAIYLLPCGPVQQTWAWFEWYPHVSLRITNYPVSPGDVMVCVICVRSPTTAIVSMKNLTTGAYTSALRIAPRHGRLVGNTAEWVLESPVNGDIGPLAKYGEVFFDYCIAGTRNGRLYNGGHGPPPGGHGPPPGDYTAIPLSMYDVNDKEISTPEFVTDRLIKIRYMA